MKTKLLPLLILTILFSSHSFCQDFYIPVLNIGIADGYEPFQFLNPETGKITGLDADIIEIILKELEIEAVYFQGDFDDVLAQ
ncbi:MAG: transporter substrate-binding domain-containing protein, partial [Spirochaetales bacterium]|nr:transporter substrate-binding domain-containing protein [Spirochaetales bacterium]